ncbi:hypothetical protein G6F42_013783 [Rhizopus arrhizus]|nr:hypothetical protein G6F42_013783 [Rhizopus arrhizus]
MSITTTSNTPSEKDAPLTPSSSHSSYEQDTNKKLLQQEIAAISAQQQDKKESDSDPGDKSKKSKKKKEKKEKQPAVPIHKLFRFATPIEAAMVLCACLLSAAIGAIQPLSIIIFGQFISNIGTSMATTQDFAKLARDVHPLVLTFVYMGIGVLIAAYTTHCFWVLTGEFQVRRIRTLYVHAILRQDMGWFDKAEEGSLTTRLATDTQLIQEVRNSVSWSCASVNLSLDLSLPLSRVGI